MKKHKNAMRYDIMTSCDGNLIGYVAIQLYSISVNLKKDIVHFYLLHRNIPEKDLQPLEALCRQLGNINFYAIEVPEAEKYDAIAAHGGGWCGEAYFSLCCHQLLPKHVKRVLYIDAGDVFFTEDISPFYHSNFEGKALVVTPTQFRRCAEGLAPCEETNLKSAEGFQRICRGLFNSGSYLVNLIKFRDEKYTIDYWLGFSQSLCELSGKEDTSQIYWGDQGFLSAAFCDDVKLYGYSQTKKAWRMPYLPYNFYIGYYKMSNVSPDYQPAIVHFAGGPKPWKMQYPVPIDRFSFGTMPFESLKQGQAEWYDLWYEYALLTDQLLKESGY